MGRAGEIGLTTVLVLTIKQMVVTVYYCTAALFFKKGLPEGASGRDRSSGMALGLIWHDCEYSVENQIQIRARLLI